MTEKTRSEGFFSSFDQTKLYYQMRNAVGGPAKASLIITHGQAEHSGCYENLMEALKPLQFDLYAWDLRGHGRSEGQRGYAKSFHDYVRDYEFFLTMLTMQKAIASKPIFLLAHSMGGLIQFKSLCERPNLPVTAQVLSSPMFGISVAVPAVKELAAQWLQTLLPKLTVGNEIRFEDLSQDPEMIKHYHKDELRHDRISSSVYLGSQQTMSQCFATADRVKIPTLMQIAENDPVTSSPAARQIFERMGGAKVLKEYSGLKHELYNELNRAKVFSDLLNFLKEF